MIIFNIAMAWACLSAGERLNESSGSTSVRRGDAFDDDNRTREGYMRLFELGLDRHEGVSRAELTNGQAHTGPGADTGRQSPMPRSLSLLALRPQNPSHFTYNKGLEAFLIVQFVTMSPAVVAHRIHIKP
jgi:hypothetical protein